jgi:acetylglutamate kinase
MTDESHILPLKRAVPYIRLYKGRTFVLKVGGNVLKDARALSSFCEDCSLLHQLGIRLVIVHGGGPQATELSKKLGHEPQIVAGRRVTNDETLEVAKMVYAGKLNLELLGALEGKEIPGIGLTGPDARLIVAKRRPRSKVEGSEEEIDWGHVGDITRVNGELLLKLIEAGYVPTICSLATDGAGGILNVNADGVARHVAVALKAEKLVLLTDRAGLLEDPSDPSSVVSYADTDRIAKLRAEGRISGGMLPKIESCIGALEGGVRRTHIIDGMRPQALLTEVFTNEGCGTMIVMPKEKEVYLHQEATQQEAPRRTS